MSTGFKNGCTRFWFKISSKNILQQRPDINSRKAPQKFSPAIFEFDLWKSGAGWHQRVDRQDRLDVVNVNDVHQRYLVVFGRGRLFELPIGFTLRTIRRHGFVGLGLGAGTFDTFLAGGTDVLWVEDPFAGPFLVENVAECDIAAERLFRARIRHIKIGSSGTTVGILN